MGGENSRTQRLRFTQVPRGRAGRARTSQDQRSQEIFDRLERLAAQDEIRFQSRALDLREALRGASTQ